jgi:aminomethyltransferase
MACVPRQTPLAAVHRELGARWTLFGGWEMPLAYPDGAIAEHLAVRRDVGVFDVSHLGTVLVEGPGAFERLQAALTNDLRKITPGRAQYTHLLDVDGSVLDDIIVWWVDEDRFHVMPNAANTENVLAALGGRDVTAERAILALQGPRAASVLGLILEGAEAPARNRIVAGRLAGVPVRVAGTGYTGGPGVELEVPAEEAERVLRALLAHGATPCGLAARDSLRLEAGLPLHGNELGPGLTPLNAGLAWVVAFDKGPFPGREALLEQRARGVRPVLVGVLSATRQPPRAHDELLDSTGRIVGSISSGGFSPLLERGIGLAYVEPEATGGPFVVERPRARLELVTSPVPFVDLRSATGR